MSSHYKNSDYIHYNKKIRSKLQAKYIMALIVMLSNKFYAQPLDFRSEYTIIAR